jgi:hypothetical protein
MKIMITGGYDESVAHTDDGGRIVQFARELADALVRKGHQLRCGNMSSLDEVVIESACLAAKSRGLDPEHVVVSYHPKDIAPRVPIGAVSGSALEDWSSMAGRRPAVPEPIDQADVVILLGGYGDASGTYTAANWARQSGTPILPVATFGMAAEHIFEDLPPEPEKARVTGLDAEDLQILTKSAAVLTDVIALRQYAERVVTLAEKAALSREVFVIMSFAETDDLEDYLAAVRSVCLEAGFEAVRTDSRPAATTHQIVDALHSHIQTCGFVIADLTNIRPNVYYEVGYAMGLHKRLVLTSKKGTEVHFDLQGFNRIEWSGHENLRKQLRPVVAEVARAFGLRE